MKLNIQIDVEEIFEEEIENAQEGYETGTLKQHIQQQIIDGVKNAISTDCMKLVQEKATKEVDKAIEESIKKAQDAINSKAVAFADDWLEKEMTVFDKWGDAQESLTIKDLIKRSFDNLMTKGVDSKGRFDPSGYGTIPLYKYLTQNRLEDFVNKKLKDLNKDIDSAIANAVNDGIRTQVSNRFAEMVVQTAKHQSAQIESKK